MKKKKTDEVMDKLDEFCENISKHKDTPEVKAYVEKLNKEVNDYQNSHNDAIKYGKRIAERLIKKFSEPIPKGFLKAQGKDIDKLSTDQASSAIASLLYHCYAHQQPSGCEELLTQWTEEKKWGLIVMDFIPKLKEIWQYLHDNKYTKKNGLRFGDLDGAIWVEYPKQLNSWPDERKIIIHRSYCTMADDNTHIFILNDGKYSSLSNTLHVRTVWPRQNSRGGYKCVKSKENPDGWFSWGDDRDIKIPSLRTYRDRNFEYSYQDGRDKGYTLTLKNKPCPSVEWAHHDQSKLQHALWIINHMKLITTDESYQCK
jgi:hypothetical protein